MRIASITAGAAGMYCGSCLRDNALAAALQAAGHDCVLIPTYTPIRTDERDVSLKRVFFGGISVYLEQKSRLFRRMPRWLDRLLSLPRLLRGVSQFAVNINPEELGPLTVSMLQGMDGRQRTELVELLDWLATEYRPEVVLLTNVLLSGLVPEMRRRLGVPIFATLQGDDIFLEYLTEPHKRQVFDLIGKNCESVHGYLVTSAYYADFMAEYLRLPRSRMHVVLPGINLEGYPTAPPKDPPLRDDGRMSIGYLARICPEKGLHQLVEACSRLRRTPDLPPVRLRVAGYLPANQREFLNQQRRRAVAEGWGNDFDLVGEVDHAAKVAFLESLDVFSVPTVYREPKGLYLLEAWACGVPVVQPAHGTFPELLHATGGGLLVKGDDPQSLAESLAQLLRDATLRKRMGRQAQAVVRERFTAAAMAEQTVKVLLSE